MVGNDVVDLGDPEACPGSLHPRFDVRVFTPDELGLIGEHGSPHRMRWMLWACKESAYKIVKRKDPAAVFSQRAFEVEIRRPETAWVHHRGTTLTVTIDCRGDALHAVASSVDHCRIISAIGETRANPSNEARTLARRFIARAISCPPSEVEIVSGPDRIPRLLVGGRDFRGSVSLSHHGRFVAFACCLDGDCRFCAE